MTASEELLEIVMRFVVAFLFARLAMRTISTYRKSGRLFILRVITIFRQLQENPANRPHLDLRLTNEEDSR